MNKQLKIGICLGILVLVGVPILWVGWKVLSAVLDIRSSVKQAYELHDSLKKPEVFTPAALSIARMCQAGVTNEYERYTNLVPHLKSGLGDCWGSVSSNEARMEFGGGFWHFGYELTLNETESNTQTNHWVLTMYTEGDTNRTLLKFLLPVSDTNFHLMSH